MHVPVCACKRVRLRKRDCPLHGCSRRRCELYGCTPWQRALKPCGVGAHGAACPRATRTRTNATDGCFLASSPTTTSICLHGSLQSAQKYATAWGGGKVQLALRRRMCEGCVARRLPLPCGRAPGPRRWPLTFSPDATASSNACMDATSFAMAAICLDRSVLLCVKGSN